VWGSGKVVNILQYVNRLLKGKVCNSAINPVMYSTMPPRDMETYPDGGLYDTLTLKTTSWSAICKVMRATSYCASGHIRRHGRQSGYVLARDPWMAKLTRIISARDRLTPRSTERLGDAPGDEDDGKGDRAVLHDREHARTHTSVYTKMQSLSNWSQSRGLIQTAIMIVNIIKETGNVMLTDQERIAAAVLSLF
jgi:hypothetical protein